MSTSAAIAADGYAAVRRYDGAVVQHARREQLVSCAVQPRDVEVIVAVSRHKFLTAPQLLELWWPGCAADVGRRRLRKLWAAGYLERFRPVATRGSFPWTYQLGREGHRLLRGIEPLSAGRRYEHREVYDYRYVLHEVHLNAWMIAWRRLLDRPPLEWRGEELIDPPSGLPSPPLRVEGDTWAEGLQDTKARQLRPDDALELEREDGNGTRMFLIEYDRTRRVDKNFEKFRRYDTFLCWWWRYSQYGAMDQLPWVVFVCQDEDQRDLFLDHADQELTGHISGTYTRPTDYDFVGRNRILFASEPDMHHGKPIAYRVPTYPPGDPARSEDNSFHRGIRLPAAAPAPERTAENPAQGGLF